MAFEASQLASSDVFFNYGNLDPQLEDQSDIICGAVQAKRSMFYNRSDGTEVENRENYPNAISLNIGLRFDIASWISYRNSQVSNGTVFNKRDRRIAASQATVLVSQQGQNVDIKIFYVPLSNLSNVSQASLPLPIGSVGG